MEQKEASEILKAATCLAINLRSALTELAKAHDRAATAIERFAEVYYHCNAPTVDDEPVREGQSLSDREHL